MSEYIQVWVLLNSRFLFWFVVMLQMFLIPVVISWFSWYSFSLLGFCVLDHVLSDCQLFCIAWALLFIVSWFFYYISSILSTTSWLFWLLFSVYGVWMPVKLNYCYNVSLLNFNFSFELVNFHECSCPVFLSLWLCPVEWLSVWAVLPLLRCFLVLSWITVHSFVV